MSRHPCHLLIILISVDLRQAQFNNHVQCHVRIFSVASSRVPHINEALVPRVELLRQ